MKISKQISDSIELKFSKIAREMNKNGKIYYSLGLGEPHFETPNQIIQSSFKAMKDGIERDRFAVYKRAYQYKFRKSNSIGGTCISEKHEFFFDWE